MPEKRCVLVYSHQPAVTGHSVPFQGRSRNLNTVPNSTQGLWLGRDGLGVLRPPDFVSGTVVAVHCILSYIAFRVLCSIIESEKAEVPVVFLAGIAEIARLLGDVASIIYSYHMQKRFFVDLVAVEVLVMSHVTRDSWCHQVSRAKTRTIAGCGFTVFNWAWQVCELRIWWVHASVYYVTGLIHSTNMMHRMFRGEGEQARSIPSVPETEYSLS